MKLSTKTALSLLHGLMANHWHKCQVLASVSS